MNQQLRNEVWTNKKYSGWSPPLLQFTREHHKSETVLGTLNLFSNQLNPDNPKVEATCTKFQQGNDRIKIPNCNYSQCPHLRK